MLEEWDFVEAAQPEPAAAAATELVAGDNLTATVIEDDGYGQPGILIHVKSWDMNIVVGTYQTLVHIQTYGPQHDARPAGLFTGRDDLGPKRMYISLPRR